MSQSFSIKFELTPGHSADLEIISAAAIAWAETLRAAAQAFDPNSDIRIRLIDVERRSALFNVVGDWFDRAAEKWDGAPRRTKLVRALAVFTLFTGYPTYETYFGDGFSPEDRASLRRIEEICSASPVVTAARQRFFRILEREPAVTAVSLKEGPDAEPYATVPREEFAEAGGLFMPEEEIETERTGPPTVIEVVLVKAALSAKPKSWTFRLEGFGDFDAVMRDAKVLQAMKEKGIRFREGMRMTVRIETKEVLRNGKWKVAREGRSVMRVISPRLD